MYRSRLKRLEETRALRSTISYIILTVVVIFLLFNFGLPALSKLTTIIGDFAGTETPNDDINSPPPPPPNIVNLPSHTKDDSVRVEGTTRPGFTVTISFNNESEEVLSNASGEFTSTFKLSKGENKIYAFVTDNRGQDSSKTQTYTVVYDNEPPKLEIIAPENGKQFTRRDNQTKIEGQTEAEAHVTINDRVAIVRSDGKFDFPITLTEGENVFKIKSNDRAGNLAEIELKLSYSP